MAKAIRIHAHGGPEVMRWEDVPTPEPGPGEVLVQHEVIGLNYIDTYFRSGLYKAALPAVLGQEGAGTVLMLGEGVAGLAVGDRVAYAGGPLGAYAAKRVITADRLVPVPPGVSSRVAAAAMLKGMTAHYLLHRTFPAKAGDTILVHAAAGGVGLILCQWARKLGVHVIGVVSTPAKAELIRQMGAAHAVLATDDVPAAVKRITGGAMVPAVFDSVGRDTFNASLDCLAPLGLMVSYGNASGPVPPFEPVTLSAKGSLFLTRPSLATYVSKRADLEMTAAALFGVLADGSVTVQVNQEYALADAAAAHRALEGRQTTGSTVLLP